MSKKHLTREDILHLAKLASLSLSDQEIETYRFQLNEILSYIEQLEELDTSKVMSTPQVTDLVNVMKEDATQKERTLKNLQNLKIVKRQNNNYFTVKRIL